MAAGKALTVARRTFMVALVMAIVLYLAGGTDGFRRAGSRIRSWMFPTQQEIQTTVVRDTTTARAPVPVALPTRLRKTRFAEPPSVIVVATVVSAIFGSALLAMYFTGRKET